MAFKAIVNLLVFILIATLIAAIVGMNLLAGKMSEATSRLNFDTFMESTLTLFVIMTGESWTVVMYDALDASTLGGAFVLSWWVPHTSTPVHPLRPQLTCNCSTHVSPAPGALHAALLPPM